MYNKCVEKILISFECEIISAVLLYFRVETLPESLTEFIARTNSVGWLVST
jgi:hypothetical protein